MNGDSHKLVTELVFDLLGPAFEGASIRNAVAKAAVDTDHLGDVELVDVEGGVGSGGRDDPHKDEWDAVDDEPHRSELGFDFCAFNHFMDIGKGPGEFDDFDGYSYRRGSAHTNEREDADTAIHHGLAELLAKLTGMKVDEGINFWFNDEYVHAPGQPWYKDCSPAMSRYSFYKDKGKYRSVQEEAAARFPLANSIASAGKGVPSSVFMPADNMARYWYGEFQRSRDPKALGNLMHVLQDLTIPQHAAGYNGNYHGRYEADLAKEVAVWVNDATFRQEVQTLHAAWTAPDPSPPTSLVLADKTRRPAPNWRTDWLATWLALNAFDAYRNVYNEYRNGYSFDKACARELTKKSAAVAMIATASVYAQPIKEDLIPFNPNHLKHDTIGGRIKVVADNIILLDCGLDMHAAVRAIQVMQHYGMNNQGFVGRPDPSMEYYTCNGQAPTGAFAGEDALQFDPQRIDVKVVASGPGKISWRVVYGNRVVVDCGLNSYEAFLCVKLIRKYGFTHVVTVGSPKPRMTYFRK